MKKILIYLIFNLITLSLFNDINSMEEQIETGAKKIEANRNIGDFEVFTDEVVHMIFLIVLQSGINELNIFSFSQRLLKEKLDKTRLISKYFTHIFRKDEFATLVKNKFDCLEANL